MNGTPARARASGTGRRRPCYTAASVSRPSADFARSLAVVEALYEEARALGAFPLADPLVGLFITLAILRIVWDSARSVLTRLLDGVDPEVIAEIEHAARHTAGVQDVAEVRVRWLGHRMHAELSVAVDAQLSVEQGHAIAKEVCHQLLHHLNYLSNATVHVDPAGASGVDHHRIDEHAHDGLASHSH